MLYYVNSNIPCSDLVRRNDKTIGNKTSNMIFQCNTYKVQKNLAGYPCLRSCSTFTITHLAANLSSWRRKNLIWKLFLICEDVRLCDLLCQFALLRSPASTYKVQKNRAGYPCLRSCTTFTITHLAANLSSWRRKDLIWKLFLIREDVRLCDFSFVEMTILVEKKWATNFSLTYKVKKNLAGYLELKTISSLHSRNSPANLPSWPNYPISQIYNPCPQNTCSTRLFDGLWTRSKMKS